MKQVKLMLGDNIESLKKLPDNSVDSIVTDGPYGLSFMNSKWDYQVPSIELWKEVYRVLKPGGHVLSFGGTRTYHRMVVNLEDGGFEIRDCISWIYGSGFPKSLNIGKQVDKIQGNEREEWLDMNRTQPNIRGNGDQLLISSSNVEVKDREPIKHSKGTSPYEGWGTALKPAQEIICVARKPISEKTVAENVLKWGCGGINIDGCRIGSEIISIHNAPKGTFAGGVPDRGSDTNSYKDSEGRFPANIIFDEEAGQMLDEQSGTSKTKANLNYKHNKVDSDSEIFNGRGTYTPREDSGGASRFFYCAKVSKQERNMGLSELKSSHPTVKPIMLMNYLCNLVTPKGGIILDPFCGSGSTGIASLLGGFRFCGMEMNEEYFKIAEARIENYELYRKFLDKKKKK